MNAEAYLKKKTKLQLIHARIPQPLYLQIQAYMKKNKLKWSNVVEATLQAFLDEVKKK